MYLSNNDKNFGNLTCPYCHLQGLSEDGLWRHVPAYHINWNESVAKSNNVCPICELTLNNDSLQRHIHDKHGPHRRSMSRSEVADSRLPNQLYNFSLGMSRVY